MPTTKLQNYTVTYDNSEEFHHLKSEVFTHDTYYFETENPAPRIIDAGAHIGLSTLYFKKLYPQAKITAIEPLPQNFKLLEKNIWENQLEDVELINAALSDHDGQETFYFDDSHDNWYSTASFLPGAWTGSQHSTQLETPTRTLSSFLTEPIDLLKLDIEGAEQRVLTEANASLRTVAQLLVEFHPHPSQKLSTVLELIRQSGFRHLTLMKDQREVQVKSATGLIVIHASRSQN